MMAGAITLRSTDHSSAATILPGRGGLVASLILPVEDQHQEVLYRRPNFWESSHNVGGMPFLFPVCGRHMLPDQPGVYDWKGTRYEMPLHGFGFNKAWRVEHVESDQLVISLTADEETRRHFPFEFTVTLEYQLSSGMLTCRQSYQNHSDKPWPLCAGFHPYFLCTELDTRDVTIEGAFRQAGHYNETYTEIARWEDVSNVVSASKAGERQYALHQPTGSDVRLVVDGVPRWSLSTKDPIGRCLFPYVQCYRSGRDPFVCIEPWMGLPNSINRLTGLTLVPPGETLESTLTLGKS